MEIYWPPLEAETLRAAKLILSPDFEGRDQVYRGEAPYDHEVLQLLADLLGSTPTAGEAPSDTELRLESDDIDIETESMRLFREMKEFGKSMKNAEAAERAAYFRVSATVLEKLLALAERARTVKHITQFQNAVMTFMDDELTPDQRNRFVQRMKDHGSLG